MVYHLASECGYSYEYIVNMTVRQIRLFFEGKSRSVTETQKGIETKEYEKDIDNKDTGNKDDMGQIKGLMSLLGNAKVKMSKKAKEKLNRINKKKMLNNKGKKDA